MSTYNKDMLKLACFYTLMFIWFCLLQGCGAGQQVPAPKLVPVMTHPLVEAGCNLPPIEHQNFKLTDCTVNAGSILCFYIGVSNNKECVGIMHSEDCMTYSVVWTGCKGNLFREEE